MPGQQHIACKKSMRQLSYLRVRINCVKISLSFFKARWESALNVFDGRECSLNRKTNYRRRDKKLQKLVSQDTSLMKGFNQWTFNLFKIERCSNTTYRQSGFHYEWNHLKFNTTSGSLDLGGFNVQKFAI